MKRKVPEKGELGIQDPYGITQIEEVAAMFRRSIGWVYRHWREVGGQKVGGSLFFPGKREIHDRVFSEVQEELEVRLHPKRRTVHRGRVFDKIGGKKSRGCEEGGTEKSARNSAGGNHPNRHGLIGLNKREA